MIGLLAAELRKLTSVITTWVMTGIGVALIVLTAGLFLAFAEFGMGRFTGEDWQIAFVVDQVGAANIIVLVVALLSMTTEFRHGTIGRTFQITPGRTRIVVAKLLAGSLYAVAFLVLGLVAATLVLLIASLVEGVGLAPGPETWSSIGFGALGLVLTSWFGVALGALLRSQVVALTITLVWLFVIESAIVTFVPSVGRWLPFNALNAVFLSDEAAVAMGEAGPQLLEPGVGLAVFIGYVVAFAAGAVALLRYRDV